MNPALPPQISGTVVNPQPLSLRSAATKLNGLKGKKYNFHYAAEKDSALADLIELFGGSVTNYLYNGDE